MNNANLKQENTNCTKNYLYCKIESYKDHKFQFYHLQENPNESTFEIYAENLFESYGNFLIFLKNKKGAKGEKKYARGKRIIPYSQINDVFGMPYSSIDVCEKKLIWNCLIRQCVLDYYKDGTP